MQAGDAPSAFVAALHCLLHVPQLVHYALSEWILKDAYVKSEKACDFLRAFANLARAYWGSAPSSASAHPAWTAFKRLHTVSIQRSDSVFEVLSAAVQSLHAALVKTPEISGSRALRAVNVEAWRASHAADGYSFVSEVFRAQVRKCAWSLGPDTPVDVAFDHPWAMDLRVDADDTVAQAISRATRDLQVPGLGAHELATMGTAYTWLPPALVVHLRRAAPRYVEYPGELDLSEHVVGFPDCRYALSAVAVSRPDGTHAVFACEDGAWSELREGTSTPLACVNDIVHKHASVLVYRSLT